LVEKISRVNLDSWACYIAEYVKNREPAEVFPVAAGAEPSI